MTQKEFLDVLQRALKGQVAPHVITENLNYYRDYISGETANGRSENDVLDELGDPRLLAKTIIEAENSNRHGKKRRSPEYDSDLYDDEGDRNFRQKSFHVNKWMVFGILLLVCLLIFSILFFVFKTASLLLFSFKGIWVWFIILFIIYCLSRRR
ncbi:MAG: DUF1700 domain-containing protein [Lachnospiraceae bacterium]|nr:DUF1700 domain-containing protein [Lachnospiraceae bacterium]